MINQPVAEVGPDLSSLPIADMTFANNPWVTTRVRNALQQNGIHTLGDLLGCTEHHLRGLRNFGAISLAHVKTKLESMGLSLREPRW